MPNDAGSQRSLRSLLLETIEQVKDGTLEPIKATAIANLSEAILSVDRFELEKAEFFIEHQEAPELAAFREPLLLEGQAEDGEATHQEPPPSRQAAKPPKETAMRVATNHQRPAGRKSAERQSPAATVISADSDVQMLVQVLRREQPLDINELSQITKKSQATLFKLLKGEQFERDTDGMYWLKT